MRYPLAVKPVPKSELADVASPISAYFKLQPDPEQIHAGSLFSQEYLNGARQIVSDLL